MEDIKLKYDIIEAYDFYLLNRKWHDQTAARAHEKGIPDKFRKTRFLLAQTNARVARKYYIKYKQLMAMRDR